MPDSGMVIGGLKHAKDRSSVQQRRTSCFFPLRLMEARLWMEIEWWFTDVEWVVGEMTQDEMR